MGKIKNWFKSSNRDLHFKYAIPVGFIFTILCVLGLATGMEYKDKLKGGIFDWNDWWATMIGGMVGQLLQIAIIIIIILIV
jgi:hypothetical protein